MHATFQGAGMSRTRLSHGRRQKKTTRLRSKVFSLKKNLNFKLRFQGPPPQEIGLSMEGARGQ